MTENLHTFVRQESMAPLQPRGHIPWVIFTDLDGTLLSAETYALGRSREALEICRAKKVPVVFVSSKTRAEIEKLRKELNPDAPFISENGGGIYLPRTVWEPPDGYTRAGHFWRLSLGKPYSEVVAVLRQSARQCGVEVQGFSDWSTAQVAEWTGLSEADARRAQQREYDEPFRIDPENGAVFACLQETMARAGCTLTSGGRFHHALCGCDKGKAVKTVMALYRQREGRVRFAGIGDAENDLPMLNVVERPYRVRRKGGKAAEGPWPGCIRITQGIGPEGFYEAVRELTCN